MMFLGSGSVKFSSKKMEEKRAWLRETIRTFNERAVLILDGLKVHTMEPFVELLRRHNVTVVVLVAHTSHMTQPLDVGIFGMVKNLIRQEGKYVINLRARPRDGLPDRGGERRP